MDRDRRRPEGRPRCRDRRRARARGRPREPGRHPRRDDRDLARRRRRQSRFGTIDRAGWDASITYLTGLGHGSATPSSVDDVRARDHARRTAVARRPPAPRHTPAMALRKFLPRLGRTGDRPIPDRPARHGDRPPNRRAARRAAGRTGALPRGLRLHPHPRRGGRHGHQPGRIAGDRAARRRARRPARKRRPCSSPQIARNQSLLYSGTEDYLVTRQFRELASDGGSPRAAALLLPRRRRRRHHHVAGVRHPPADREGARPRPRRGQRDPQRVRAEARRDPGACSGSSATDPRQPSRAATKPRPRRVREPMTDARPVTVCRAASGASAVGSSPVALFATTMVAARSFAPAGARGGGGPAPGGRGGPDHRLARSRALPAPAGAYVPGRAIEGVFVNCSPACDLIVATEGSGLPPDLHRPRHRRERARALSPDGSQVVFRCGSPADRAGRRREPQPEGLGDICVVSTQTPTIAGRHAAAGDNPAPRRPGSTTARRPGRPTARRSRIDFRDDDGHCRDRRPRPRERPRRQHLRSRDRPPRSRPGRRTDRVSRSSCGVMAMPAGATAERFCTMAPDGTDVVQLRRARSGHCGAPGLRPGRDVPGRRVRRPGREGRRPVLPLADRADGPRGSRATSRSRPRARST